MPRNVYFSQGAKSEQNLYEDITIEGLKIYGHDAYYIPRKIVNEDGIFNEDQLSEGDVVRQRPGQPHQIKALTDGRIFEVSTHHEDSDSYRVIPGDSQK